MLEDAVFVPSTPGVFASLQMELGRPASWCGAFREPPGLEGTKPDTDGCVPQESRPASCPELLNVSRRASRHDQKRKVSPSLGALSVLLLQHELFVDLLLLRPTY